MLLVMTFVAIQGGTPVFASNTDPDNDGSRYAWGENLGWLNFQSSFALGVTVDNSAMTGYVWGENIGWINLNPANGGVINDGAGILSGYAWGENVGWIDFAPTGGGVIIDPNTGIFSGYAWGENIGWISFDPTYCEVKTYWRCEVLTLSSDLKLHIPKFTYQLPSGNTMVRWVDFEYVPGSGDDILFKVSDYGEVE
jgi:hypothetical protein